MRAVDHTSHTFCQTRDIEIDEQAHRLFCQADVREQLRFVDVFQPGNGL
jgi:hypothetical protein